MTTFCLDKPELRALARLIEEARALPDAPGGPLRISRYQAGFWDELAALGVTGHQAAAWREQVQGLLSAGSLGGTEPPAGLRARLRPYQQDGSAGWRSCGSTGWAGSSPTTWGSARPCSPSP